MRFLVLGPLEVSEAGGTPLRIAGSKERTILACLVAHAGRVVPVDDLVDELWGDSPPRAPEKTLTSYVSRLRRDLQPGRAAGANGDVIVFRSGGYALERDGHEIDAVEFEELAAEGHRLLESGQPDEAEPVLARALDLWRGAAYQEYRYTGVGAVEGDRLDELRRTAAEDLIESRLGAPDPGRLVSELEAMVREEPLRERRWAQLMVALYRAGRQGEALRAFGRAREVLVGELGVEPGAELQRLQAAILAHDPGLDRTAAPEPERTIDVCPYKGLARFEATDAEFFFGREPVVAEAIGRLVGSRFLALIGPSGSGKSSLLRAGLVHALQSGAIPGSDRWTVKVIRPGDHPLAALGDALAERPGHTVLAIDQFEETFTACSDADERTAFLDAITRAATPDGAVTVALAMRADFYGRCTEHRALASLVATQQILVGPMDADELRRAIELPAARAGLIVEGDLIEALVSDTVGQPGGLPLLSTALLELWTHRRDETLRLEEYLRAGGVEGAVARLAEDAYARLDETQQAAAKRILLRLAAPGESAEVVGRQAPLTEFDLDRDRDAARAMTILADARLVTVSKGTAEVAHEALLREWPRLRTWLEEDADGRALQRHVTEATHSWDEGGRDAADLYRGARLTAAWDWLGVHAADLNDLERQFLQASQSASEGDAVRSKRTNRRLRGLLIGVAVLLVASLVIGDVALSQRDRTTDALTLADAGRLASQSRLERDPQLALLMARNAVAISDSPETRSALFAALERTPAIVGRMYAPSGPSPAGDETQWIVGSSDGRTLAIGDAGPTVTFFDAARGAVIGAVDVGSGTDRAAFSPDGNTLAVATTDGDLVAIDASALAVRDRAPASGTIDAMAFDPGGTDLITAEHRQDLTESLIRHDPVTFAPVGRPVAVPGHDGATFPTISRPLSPFAMAFAGEGKLLVTTRDNGPTIAWTPDLTPVQRFPRARGQAVAVSPNGHIAALVQNDEASNEGTVAFLDLDTGRVRIGSGGHEGSYKTNFEAVGATFTPDGRSVVTVGNDSRLVVWDVATATVRSRLAETGNIPLRGPVVSPDGTTAYTTDRTGDVVVWDLSRRERLDRPFSAGAGFPGWPWFAMSADGKLLAVPSSPGDRFNRSGYVSLIDMDHLTTVRTIPYGDGSPQAVAFSPDGRTLAVTSVGQARPSDAELWDVATGHRVATLKGIEPGQRLVAIRFSPDGTLVVGAGSAPSGGSVYVWSLGPRTRLTERIHTHLTAEDVSFTPDGSELVIATGWDGGGDLVFWDTGARQIVGTQPADAAIWSTAVSDDGRSVMTGSQTSVVRLWALPSGAPLGSPFDGLLGSVDTVDVSPDGTTAVGADDAGNVLLWDVASRSTLGDPLPGPTPGTFAAAMYAPGGTRVVVVSDTGAAWVWNVDPADWLSRACAVAGRNLTLQEWQEVLPDRAYQPAC
ncbi:MAG: BTAD domain-containing putative transcriptional regulator [Actinomycetota bacterium]